MILLGIQIKMLLMVGKERGLAAAMGSTAIMTQNETLSGMSQFSDYTNSDPLGKFKAARVAVRDGCGFPPDAAVMDWETANCLAYHPAILDALGFTQNRAGQLSEAELAKAMGIEQLFIAKGVYNTAALGQTDSLGAIWGKDIVFFYRPKSASLRQKSLGYNLSFAGQGVRQVFRHPVMNPPGSEEVIVRDSYYLLLSDVSAGYLIKDAIA